MTSSKRGREEITSMVIWGHFQGINGVIKRGEGVKKHWGKNLYGWSL